MRRLAVAAALIVTVGGAVGAQSRDSMPPRGRGARGARAGQLLPNARARAGRDTPPPATAANANQQALARQVRQAFAGVVRRQLSLNDDQARRLQQVDDYYQKQRGEVNKDEREARLALKTALEDSTATPDQAKVDEYMGRLVKAQRRRAELLEAEQKDLSGFLNPVQRAKYVALRDQLNRRIAQLRQQGTAAAPAAAPPGTVPPLDQR